MTHGFIHEWKTAWREAAQGIHSANGLKAEFGAKKLDFQAIAFATKENAVKKTLGKKFAIPLDSDFFKHPVYSYGLKKNLFARLDSSKKGDFV